MFSKFYFFTLLFVGMVQIGYAQQGSRTISGLVTSEDSAPLEGVAVSIKGTNNVSGSQADGIYYLSVRSKDSILVFSHADCQTQEIKLNSSNEYNVVMFKKQIAAAGLNVSLDQNWLASFKARQEHEAPFHKQYAVPER